MSDSFAKLRQNPVFISTMDTLQKISNKNKLSMSQVAILYALNKKFVTSVVVSVSTIKELEENMNTLNQGLKLNQEDVGLYYFQNYDLYIF
jgi:aryl-alcohol dehydrogenase-like predicted oxidoreductase